MAITTIRTDQLREGHKFFFLDGTRAMTGDINMDGNKIINLPLIPTENHHGASKYYVDFSVQGYRHNPAVNLVAIDNITLSGNQTIDGVGTSVDMRVLVTGQTDKTENGVYLVKTTAWVRADDFVDGTAQMSDYYFVGQGTNLKGSGWVCVTPNPITIGTTEIDFSYTAQASDYAAGDGIDSSQLILGEIAVEVVSGGALTVGPSGVDMADIVTPGTNTKITYDKYGRVTSASAATTADIAESGNLYFTNTRVYNAITGAISPWTEADFNNANRVAISNGLRKLDTSDITTDELDTLDGIDTAQTVQTQLNARLETINYIVRESPTPAPDNSTTDFSLSNNFTKEHVYLNGVLQNEGTGLDYTADGSVGAITFTFPPNADDVILVTYIKTT